jgi:hypothetical protein
MTMEEDEERKRKFIEQHMRHHMPSMHAPADQQASLDVWEARALVAWDRLQVERGEHLDVTRYYQQIARDDLRMLKKRLGNRTRMTITVPERIHQRLSHVPTGLRSACVTRLLARGWLWENAYGGEEVLEDG